MRDSAARVEDLRDQTADAANGTGADVASPVGAAVADDATEAPDTAKAAAASTSGSAQAKLDAVVSDAPRQSQEPDGQSQGQEPDAYYSFLAAEYNRYRIMAYVLAIAGAATLFLAVALFQSHILVGNIYSILMTIANMCIILWVVIVFTRLRPFKKQMRAHDPNAPRTITDPTAADGVRIEQRTAPDFDGFYKIFERGVRTELIPDLPEYHKLRKTWITLFVVAAVVGLVSIGVYIAVPSAELPCAIGLIAAFALVVGAFYVDRTKMKPMRVEWARSFNMTEMEARDNLL